jgi:hypothetical protein
LLQLYGACGAAAVSRVKWRFIIQPDYFDDHNRHSRPYPFRSQPDRLPPPGRRPHGAVFWAFARHFGGTFVLRIEDTDVERSTPEAVQAIIEGMVAGPGPHEGPFYQMKRMDRYREVVADAGKARPTTATRRRKKCSHARAQRAAGEKPRYDGTWRPEPGKCCRPFRPAASRGALQEPAGRRGELDDVVKGTITIANKELDDLVIARPDGTPTYNFCVAVDDWTWKSRTSARRRPRQQHAAPDQHPARHRRAAAGTATCR